MKVGWDPEDVTVARQDGSRQDEETWTEAQTPPPLNPENIRHDYRF